MRSSTDTARARTVVVLAGFSFLIYEVVWHRLLSLVLGATVAASTIVLAAFMAGFGVGAWFWGRRGDLAGSPARTLSVLLMGLGGMGFTVYAVSAFFLPGFYATAGEAAEIPVFLIASLLLFGQAFFMGGIFPLASAMAVGERDSIGATLGRLYAWETLGSTVGGLAAGFLLLGFLGMRGTTALAVIVDLVLAMWLLSKTVPTTSAAAEPAPAAKPRRKKKDDAPADPSHRTAAVIAAFACGFAILALQVLWMRMFRIYLTNTSYTFALVSSLAILGIFVGSRMFSRSAPSASDRPRALVRTLLWAAAATGVGLVVLLRLPQLLMFPFQGMLGDPMARALLLPAVAALLVVVPPAVASGYAFPLTCRMYASGRGSLGADVGRVLMVNTVGSVVGPLIAAFVLLPTVGAVKAALLMTAIFVFAASLVRRRVAPGERGGRMVLEVLAGALAMLAVVGPQMRILPPSFHRFDRDVLFYRESVEGTLSVGEDRGTRTESKYTFVNNSAVIGSTYDAVKVVKMVGHFPFFIGRDVEDVLVVGFGIGVTTSAIASHPEVRSIDCVELVPGLREAAVYYTDLNHGVYDDERLTIIPGDGRHHLQRTSKTYDLISCDPTHPILGSGNLYTTEYFELVREHLNPGGVVSQYLPLHKLRTEEFLGIVATFGDAFPHATVWLGHIHAVLLGSTDPIAVDMEAWSARIAASGADEHFYNEPHHLAATLVLDEAAVRELAATRRLNTDDLCYTEFFHPDCLDADNLALNMEWLLEHKAGLMTVFSNVADPARLSRFDAGNKLMTQSLIHRMRGDRRRGLQTLQRACQVNPEDREYPFLIRLDY